MGYTLRILLSSDEAARIIPKKPEGYIPYDICYGDTEIARVFEKGYVVQVYLRRLHVPRAGDPFCWCLKTPSSLVTGGRYSDIDHVYKEAIDAAYRDIENYFRIIV